MVVGEMTNLLTFEEKELLRRASTLIEELIETLEISADKELVKDINDSLVEVRQGKTRPFVDLLKDLGLEGQVQI